MKSSTKPKLILTLAYLIKDNQVLLTMKKRGFGVGKYNGFGGKIEGEESVEENLVREGSEELNIKPINYTKVGIIDFEFLQDEYMREIHIFLIDKWKGTPTESEEVKPEWFEIDKVPYDKMWPIDRYMLPHIFGGEFVEGYVKFDKEIIENKLRFDNQI